MAVYMLATFHAHNGTYVPHMYQICTHVLSTVIWLMTVVLQYGVGIGGSWYGYGWLMMLNITNKQIKLAPLWCEAAHLPIYKTWFLPESHQVARSGEVWDFVSFNCSQHPVYMKRTPVPRIIFLSFMTSLALVVFDFWQDQWLSRWFTNTNRALLHYTSSLEIGKVVADKFCPISRKKHRPGPKIHRPIKNTPII